MASIKIISRRIKSAQNISQITKAMEMVAASKMKKAQDLAVSGKPYADRIMEVTRELAAKTDRKVHPLLSTGNPGGKPVLIIISTNKGLCGGLNANLFRYLNDHVKDNKNYEYISVGNKGQSFVVRSGRKLIADFSEKTPFISTVPAVTELMVNGFLNGEYSQISVGYNSFVSALKQLPVIKRLLPLADLGEGADTSKSNLTDYVMEPSADEILDSLLPHYIENQLRAAILESEASEHSARMVAMKNATDAASDLIGGLTLVYNKVRQEKITYEISDMVTARLAVE